MHFTQGFHHLPEHAANGCLGDQWLVPFLATMRDVLLQRAAMFISHYQVDGVVGAKDIKYAYDVRVHDAGQHSALIEKIFQADPIELDMFSRNGGLQCAFGAHGQRTGQVFFDGHSMTLRIFGQVDNTEAADGNLLYNAIAAECEPVG